MESQRSFLIEFHLIDLSLDTDSINPGFLRSFDHYDTLCKRSLCKQIFHDTQVMVTYPYDLGHSKVFKAYAFAFYLDLWSWKRKEFIYVHRF